jgi:hypothetical protein
MRRSARDRLRFGAAAVGAVLVAAPGVHLFERWLAPGPAIWVSHVAALGLLGVVAWRWMRSRRLAGAG